MCKHHFEYPEDKRENYNPDGKTLTGICRCGATKRAYGMRWSIPVEEAFLQEIPYGESLTEFGKSRFIC